MTTENGFDIGTLTEAFTFLDQLRESGAINMFGAAPHLADYMQIEVRPARAICILWSETFSRNTTPAARATAAVLAP